MHTYTISIKPDSIFEFQAGYEGGSSFSIGKCSWENDSTLVLNLDKRKTFEKCLSDGLKTWWPASVNNWKFILRKDVLMPTRKRTD